MGLEKSRKSLENSIMCYLITGILSDKHIASHFHPVNIPECTYTSLDSIDYSLNVPFFGGSTGI